MADESFFAKNTRRKITANARGNDARYFAKIVWIWSTGT
jgi:hypothetical protein